MTKKERVHTYATALALMISILHPQIESCRLEEKQESVEVQADSGYKVLVMAVERLGKEIDRLHARLDRAEEDRDRDGVAMAPTTSFDERGPEPDPPPPPPKRERPTLPSSIKKAQQAVQRGDIGF